MKHVCLTMGILMILTAIGVGIELYNTVQVWELPRLAVWPVIVMFGIAGGAFVWTAWKWDRLS